MAKEEFDIFHHYRTYKNADKIFTTELPPIESVKDSCIFVFDTNALLVPFSTGSDSLDVIGKIFELLKKNGQLKIPEQVAREFADNRPKKIGEMFNALNQKRNGMNDPKIGSYPLLENLPEYSEVIAIEKEISLIFEKYRKSIGKIIDTVKAWSWDDPVSLLYRKIFTPEIIDRLLIDEKEIQENLSYRYLHKIPPGYKDDGKADSGIGDLLIWLSILEIGKKNQKDVVFISGDEKADWYHKSNKFPLYPRFELLTEFQSISNRSFYIMRLSQLLDLMGADKKVISEVKVEEQIENSRFEVPPHIIAERAVYFYYKGIFDNVVLEPAESRRYYDFSYYNRIGGECAVIVISLRDNYQASKFVIKDKLRRISESKNLSNISETEIVFVARNEEFPIIQLFEEMNDFISNVKLMDGIIKILKGYLDTNQNFKML